MAFVLIPLPAGWPGTALSNPKGLAQELLALNAEIVP